ncbi:hypothetical protein QN355_09040 [Cryobacterium sp. 10S3]|uniref:hypothetical protein n=1 Tax=unclassified Cryobacterium TaxID=2649013 RepID=UPI002AC8E523|nr:MULTISPECIES: hypothetical protein [unclassified Cryobacterium]MEB0001663.1 hypothetical protein [Cryobacterium sp. RTC2.1]MEB0286694.1 hypothetical protein [Cryobacterium sp. 10S3]WPX13185.1 hypothetical protein RHM57_16170 [Cryobacterium sp. 10S3]
MTAGQAPEAAEQAWPGITRLTTERDSVILVDWELRAYNRAPGVLARRLYADEQWLRFTDIGSLEIGRCATFVSPSQTAGNYISSPLVAIERMTQARELSAADIETVRFIGGYINRRTVPPPRQNHDRD